jgi:hypothetical protein
MVSSVFPVIAPDMPELAFALIGSTWHVIEYNSTTGNVIKKRTAQGYSDSSTWSRGQAWGIYGFANSVFEGPT